MKLTEEQKRIVAGIFERLKKGIQITRMGGYAGTGKTTLIAHLVKALPSWSVCAFTGKAASVLRQKGVPASTIHSLIYRPLMDDKGDLKRDDYGNPIFARVPDLQAGGIIVDEASMISRDLYEDLVSFHIPIIFVGDHGQLEPVGKDINLMNSPDFVLETIHRNAGEIARFCEFIRHGYRPAAFRPSFEGKVKFLSRWQANQYLTQVDQVICAFNKTRVELNRRIRATMGRMDDIPVVGDRVMCLRNNRKIGVFNGMQGEIKYLYTRKNRMHFKSDEGTLFDIIFNPENFNQEKYELQGHLDDPLPFDFCNAVTCHKAQGSEWDRLMVFEQRGGQWDHIRWAYTAASRARELLYWVAL